MDAISAHYGSSSSSSSSESDAEESKVDSHKRKVLSSPESSNDRSLKRPRDEKYQWVRNFEHVDGQWPSHIRLNLKTTLAQEKSIKDMIAKLNEYNDSVVSILEEDGSCHLSLTKPFVLTYDQIDPFIMHLRRALQRQQGFYVSFDKPIALANDHDTRSFFAFKASEGTNKLSDLVTKIDNVLEQYDQPTYYQDPIFHTSVASAPSRSLVEAFNASSIDKDKLSPPLHDWRQRMTSAEAVIGNKRFDIPFL